jgi:EAL domain-containing protein (putative c-di-GMP-specific phosphodiesterase class I)/PAS domain-containing protein/GGDEF domain-containing protein
MSASHSARAPIRVLLAEDSEETANRIDSVLRDAGFPTRIQRTGDIDDIEHCVGENECDLAYFPATLPDLEHLLPRLRGRNRIIPLIIYTAPGAFPEGPAWTPGEAMTHGASDLVCLRDDEHLTHVSAREIEHVCQRVRAAQLAKSLKEVEQRCHLLLQGSRAPIAYIHEGMHVYANPAYLQFFGAEDVDDVLGVSVVDFLAAESVADFKEQLKLLRSGSEEVRFPFQGSSIAGAALDGMLVLANSSYEGESCLQLTVLPSQPAPVMQPPVQTDTNLDLGTFLKTTGDRMAQAGEALSWMFLVSLEGLDKVRTEFGFLRAEKIADEAFRLIEESNPDSPVLRFSQDEVAASLIGTDRNGAFTWATTIQRNIARHDFGFDGPNFPITISLCGIKISKDIEHALDAGYQQLKEIIASNRFGSLQLEADVAPVEAPLLDEAGKTLVRITDAIENQSFRLLYQPIISLRGDDDEHYEVFLRMIDSEGNEHVPDQFLRTAIDHGVAAKIDRWVILQSIKSLCLHRAKGHNTRLTINVTSNSVADGEFIKWLTVAIKAARLPSDAVIFQITENDARTFIKQTGDFVAGLKKMHCQASIGRFGLAANPYQLLENVHVGLVKIDGSLIKTLQKPGDTITPMLKELQSMGKLTIVPMVESAAQLTALWQGGANYIQGHYLQEPRPEMDYDFSVEEAE